MLYILFFYTSEVSDSLSAPVMSATSGGMMASTPIDAGNSITGIQPTAPAFVSTRPVELGKRSVLFDSINCDLFV
jgi:hypothetical protein